MEKVVPTETRLQYRNLADMIYSLGNTLNPYIKQVDTNNLNLTKDYQIFISKNLDDLYDDSVQKIILKKVSLEPEYIINSSFSKKTNELLASESVQNINMGLELHSILENLDFYNPDFDNIQNEYYKIKVKKFYSQLKNVHEAKVFQEYEFLYNDENNLYHGIIDLMLEYNDHIDIIDYKLKHVYDEAYLKQLKGYKNYISKISNKIVNIYLYSLIEEEFTLLS